MVFRSVNPATEVEFATYDPFEAADIDDALDASVATFDRWRETPAGRRRAIVERAGELLEARAGEYADLMTREMGKPIGQAQAEIEKCAAACAYYAERAGEHLQSDVVGGGRTETTTYVAYEPIGPVLAIMPWNFPFWQVFRIVAPNLAAGNTVLLKHAPSVTGCALEIESVLRDAGAPEGTFQTLLVEEATVDDLIADRRVRAVTLTGSTGAGRAVAESAGRNLKKTVLELGGSDPFVVLDDAPVERAARAGVRARTINSGQSCVAAKRFIVHDDVYDEFLERFLAEVDQLHVGDPTDPETDVGPQARDDLLETLHRQVSESVDAGATLHRGGEPLDRCGYFYPPTVLSGVPGDAPAATEELFGPVAAVFRAPDREAAVELANGTAYGLGASVWTRDVETGERIAREFEAGCAFVNDIVQSDPRLPFGGVKDSGYGRELGRFGVQEFVNTKTVWVSPPESPDE